MPQLELRGEGDQRFAVAEEEVTAVDEAVVEVMDHHTLRRVVEVNDHVAAEDQVEVAEERDPGRVVEVETAELHAVADLILDTPRVVGLPGEVALAHGGLGGPEGVLAVLPLAGSGQYLLVDVAGEDLERRVLVPARLLQEHGQRVRLLTRRAARRPDADLLEGLLRQQVGYDLLDEGRELGRLAKEVGLVRRDQVVDRV